LRQMTTASLKVYAAGPDTRAERRAIVLEYLNTLPLAAVPGYGEVYGLGEGLRAWFGMDLDEVREAVTQAAATEAKARAYKHVLALLYAVRAPAYYLVQDRAALEGRVTALTRALEAAAVID